MRRVKTIAVRVALVATFALLASGARQDWTRVAARTGAPGARALHTAVFEPHSDRMIVFGGRRQDGTRCTALDDTWILTHPGGLRGRSAWTPLAVEGARPAPRHSHTAAYDPTNDRMIVFGGNRDDRCRPLEHGTLLDDLWILEHATGSGPPIWHRIDPEGEAPQARESHTAVYDARANRMTIFGGTALPGSCAGALNDLWVLSNANGLGGPPEWTNIDAKGTTPSPRRGHTAVYDASADRMILFGGEHKCGGELNDLFVLAHPSGLNGETTWFRGAAKGPTPPGRAFHAAVFDATANRMTVLGGRLADAILNDVWVLTTANGLGPLATWEKSASGDVTASARAGHTGILDAASQRVTVFGGSSRTSIHGAWTLSHHLATNSVLPGDSSESRLSNDTWTLRDGLLVDTVPPVILSTTANPGRIPYANRRLVPVELSVTATDEYDPDPRCGIVSAASSVAPLGSGADWQITGPLEVLLRSERPRGGMFDSRKYTLTVQCTDTSGNRSTSSVVVSTLPPEGLEKRHPVSTTSATIP